MSIKIEGVIEWFERRAKEAQGKGSREAFLLAVDALREKAEREDPKPLTLEEVKNADGPLWIAQLVTRGIECDPDWAILTDSGVPGAFYVWWFGSECEETARHVDYGKTWIAYRHKPKDVTDINVGNK